MRRVFVVLWALVAGAGVAGAEDRVGLHRALSGEACPVALPEWATVPEVYAWGRICAGDVADMQLSTGDNDGAGCNASDGQGAWPESRLLSPRFVQLITAREPYVSAPAQPAVRMRCARFDEPVRLDDEIIPQTLRIDHSRMAEGVSLTGARFRRDLSFDGSVLDAPGLVAGGLESAGSLFLRGGVLAAADLDDASVGGHLDASGARFTGPFSADALSVGGSVLLRDGAELADLRLVDAAVGGSLQMQGSGLAGRIDLSQATVGDLTLWRDNGTNPVWGATSSLILRNVQAGALHAQMPESWMRTDATTLPVDLQGFRYDRLGGLGAGSAGDLGRIGDVTALIDWVEASSDSTVEGTRHAPQPYFQLESVLRDMGAARSADRVSYARHLDRLDSYGTGLRDRIARAGEQVWRYLVGFGVYPFRLLWWIGGLMIAGTVVASLTQPLRVAGWRDYRRLLDCFWYSVENTLPLVERSGDNRGIVHEHWATRSAFHFQKIAGFVLATILVGALTLVGS